MWKSTNLPKRYLVLVFSLVLAICLFGLTTPLSAAEQNVNSKVQTQLNTISQSEPVCDNPQPVDIQDLTGTWQADDGGTYYLHQTSNTLWWYGEATATNPSFSNVFMGSIQSVVQCENRSTPKVIGTINGNWVDVPKANSKEMYSEVIQLDIDSTSNILTANPKLSGFSGGVWTRYRNFQLR